MLMTSSKIIDDLVNSATGAKAHFEIFWALTSEAKPDLLSAMNAHSDFFRASSDAHYTAFFVSLAHLFDRRSDSSSIPTYFSSIRKMADPGVLAALEDEFTTLAQRARPLVTARHKTVAHIDSVLTEKDVFTPLEITWDEVRTIIYDSANFVAKLASECSESLGIPRDGRLIEATLNMVQSLNRPKV